MLSKYIKVGNVLYVRADETDAAAKKALKILLETWYKDGKTKETLQGLNLDPEKLDEKFGIYVAELATDLMDWKEELPRLMEKR